MKWLILLAVAGVLYAVLRFMNRDRNLIKDVPFELTPIPPPQDDALPTSNRWALRTPMSFDDFYTRF